MSEHVKVGVLRIERLNFVQGEISLTVQVKNGMIDAISIGGLQGLAPMFVNVYTLKRLMELRDLLNTGVFQEIADSLKRTSR